MSRRVGPPRIAIVGGGIAGTLCSLVLKSRGLHPVIIDQAVTGLGGRLRGVGAQFLRGTDPRLQSVMSMLQGAKLIQPWRARFGMLGSQSGGFLPSSIVASGMSTGSSCRASSGTGILGLTPADPSSMTSNMTSGANNATDTGDFCHFVQDSEISPTYVGVPGMKDLCPQIASLADLSTVSGTKVVGASMAVEGGWILDLDKSPSNHQHSEQQQHQHFDALILATHNPYLASTVIQTIVDAELTAGGYSSVEDAFRQKDAASDTSNMFPLVLKRLSTLSQHLQQVRDEGRMPLFTVQSTYPMGFSDSIPFDAVSVPGSQVLQFMAREGSKPEKLGMDADVWTAISTSQLAAQVLAREDLSIQAKEDYIQSVIVGEMAKLLSHYFDGDPSSVPLPTAVQVKCWGAAICGKGLELQEDSITLSSWRLGICGDFIRQSSAYSTPWEAAALSGLEAGERMTSLLANIETTTSSTKA